MLRLAIAIGALILVCGCGILPQSTQLPEIHNPFPQLTKVAVAPFFNLSSEPTVDGRQFGAAYFAALQSIPGFEVVPVGVVEQAVKANNIQLNGPEQARQLAQILGVDAVVIGAVTDFSPYYPPRCGLQVEWYAANPGFPSGSARLWIAVGYRRKKNTFRRRCGLEAEMALARKQLATQTPNRQIRRSDRRAAAARFAAARCAGATGRGGGAGGSAATIQEKSRAKHLREEPATTAGIWLEAMQRCANDRRRLLGEQAASCRWSRCRQRW